jgi:hypothetical protein
VPAGLYASSIAACKPLRVRSNESRADRDVWAAARSSRRLPDKCKRSRSWRVRSIAPRDVGSPAGTLAPRSSKSCAKTIGYILGDGPPIATIAHHRAATIPARDDRRSGDFFHIQNPCSAGRSAALVLTLRRCAALRNRLAADCCVVENDNLPLMRYFSSGDAHGISG